MKQKRLAPEFFKNSFYHFISFFLTHIGGAIFTILVARIISPELFGVYTLTLSIIVIFMIIGNFGLNEALIRYVSLNFKNKQKAKSYSLYFFKIKIFVLLILAAVLMISSKLIASFYGKPELSYMLIIGGFYLFFYSLMQFISSLFYAFKNIKAYVFKEFIFHIVRICLIPLLFVFTFGYLAAGPIIFVIISSIASIIFIIVYLFKKYPDFFKQKKVQINKKELFNYIKYLSLGVFSIIFLVHTDILILGKFVDFEYLGFYRTASSAAVLFASFLSLTAVLYPIFTQINKKRIQEIFHILLYYLFLFSIPMALGVSMLSRPIIKILFGEVYAPAAIVLAGLSFVIIVFPAGELFRALLNSKGKSKLTGKIIFYASMLNIILNFVLIYLFLAIFNEPIYAALGVGIATVISRFIIFFSLVRVSKKKFQIKIKPSIILKPIIASLIMGLFIFIFSSFIYTGENIFLIILEVIMATMVYFLSLYFINGISIREINYISEIIKETIHKK